MDYSSVDYGYSGLVQFYTFSIRLLSRLISYWDSESSEVPYRTRVVLISTSTLPAIFEYCTVCRKVTSQDPKCLNSLDITHYYRLPCTSYPRYRYRYPYRNIISRLRRQSMLEKAIRGATKTPYSDTLLYTYHTPNIYWSTRTQSSVPSMKRACKASKAINHYITPQPRPHIESEAEKEGGGKRKREVTKEIHWEWSPPILYRELGTMKSPFRIAPLLLLQFINLTWALSYPGTCRHARSPFHRLLPRSMSSRPILVSTATALGKILVSQ